jgi:hypothetical protein
MIARALRFSLLLIAAALLGSCADGGSMKSWGADDPLDGFQGGGGVSR